MIPAMIGYSIDETTGFPNDYKFAQVNGQRYRTYHTGIQLF